MIHAASIMTWQHWAVIAEMWFSVILLAILVDRGRYSAANKKSWLWLPWDLAFLGLFVWGCTRSSWEATVYIVLMVLGMVSGIRARLDGKVHTWETEDAKNNTVNGVVIMASLASLLVVFA